MKNHELNCFTILPHVNTTNTTTIHTSCVINGCRLYKSLSEMTLQITNYI